MRLIIGAILIATILAACNQQSAKEYSARGDQYAKAKKWGSAVIEFKNSIKQEPENALARAKLGKAYVEIANADAAIKELNRALEYGYSRDLLLIPLAKAYLQNGEFARILEEITIQSQYPRELMADVLSFRAIAWLGTGNKKASHEALQQARKLDQNRTEVRLAWAIYEKSNNNTDAQKIWLKPLLTREGGIADAWSQWGEIAQGMNDMGPAEQAYTQSIELRPYGHIDSIRRATVRIAQGNLDGAQDDVNVILKAGATWPVVEHTNGIIAFKRSDLRQAQLSLQKVLSKYPEYSPSQLLLALVYRENRQYQSAMGLLEQYLSQHPGEHHANIIYVRILLKVGRADKAIERLVRLDQSHPNNSGVLSLLSQAYHQQGNSEQALQYLSRAIKLNPGQTDLRLQLASMLIKDPEKIAQGRIELQTILKQDPNNQKANQFLYLSYMRERKFTKAREIAGNVEKLAPESPVGINMRALSYSEANRDKTIELLKQARSRFPTDDMSANNLARVYFQEGEFGKAKIIYEELLEKNDSNIKVLTQLAIIAARQQRQEESLEWIKKAYERNPGELSPKLLLASRYLQVGEADMAIDVLDSAGKEHRNSVAFIMLQAQAKLAANKVQQSIRSLNKLISDNPGLPAAHFLLAQSYAKDEKPDRMRRSLLDAVELDPDYLQAHLALARLDLFEGELEAFKNRVNRLSKRYPDNGAVLLLAAKLDTEEQNYDQAIGKLSSLAEVTSYPEVIIDLSINQWKSGDREGAISSLEF